MKPSSASRLTAAAIKARPTPLVPTRWGRERRIELEPFGLDYSSELVGLASQRFPGLEDHFYIANAWMWEPPRRFDFVYTLYDHVPLSYLADYMRQLLGNVVTPGGRLIVGAYGSRTRNEPSFDVANFMAENGFDIAGMVSVGNVPEARFAWTAPPISLLRRTTGFVQRM